MIKMEYGSNVPRLIWLKYVCFFFFYFSEVAFCSIPDNPGYPECKSKVEVVYDCFRWFLSLLLPFEIQNV